jgi:nitrogen fixation protein NifB
MPPFLTSDPSSRHPCFSPAAHLTRGRVHLPVSPACNIACGFCRREFNKNEVRPGVAGRLITPDEAPRIVAQALDLCPEISVVGIAGPGDTLATPHAVQAFRAVKERFPDLVLCLSTNGLLLEERLDDLLALGLGTLTVTVNGVDPGVVARIVPQVLADGRVLHGVEGTEVLVRRQLAGIRRAAAAGLVIKVNQVLVPGVNDHHVEVTARTVADAGASLFNLIPLIPQFRFADTPAPTEDGLDRARKDAERHLKVFRHCQHCRADACGIPGKRDLSFELYGGAAVTETFSHG